MSSFLPDGFRLRGLLQSDIEVAAAILRAEEEQIRGKSEWGVAETIDFWRHVNPDAGSWIVETEEGAPVAFAATLEREDDTECWSSVHPSFTGRGIAGALLGKVERRARERGARRLEVGAFAGNDA